jgi:alanine racemase
VAVVCDPAVRAGAVLEIDLEAIARNWRLLARRAAPAACAAVVKADAYGLGVEKVAPRLAQAGCRLFFVATLEEGIFLRGLLPEPIEIAVFNGPFPGSAEEFVAHRLLPVLNDPGQIEDWGRLACEKGGLGALFHLDTGMARLGLSNREFASFLEQGGGAKAILWRGFMSHLACAEDPLHPQNALQLRRFLDGLHRFGAFPASLAASSGIFLGRDYHFDLVRPGAALYGVNPQPQTPNPMRQVVRLKGRIVQVREVDRGASVGYGAAHLMEEPGRLATVAMGYADGWPRSMSPRGSAKIGGKRVPLVGRVSMDLSIFEVSGVDPSLVRPGAFVDLLDEEYGVDRAAAAAGTIGYEILTALGRRYHRVYRGPAS